MDQDQIRTILAVERTGSFTQAAELLHVTQSTVTARVRQLEQELGATIWDRTTRRMILTADGAKLMALFERVNILFDRIRDTADSDGYSRHVVFGSVHSQWSGGILPLLNGWVDQQTEITWRLITGHSRELLDWIRDGAIDMAVTYFGASEHGLRSIQVTAQRLALFAAPSRGIQEPIESDAVKRQHSLAYVEWGPPFTDWFRQEFDALSPVVQVDQAPLLIQILEEGGHVGFMPAALAQGAVRGGRLVEMPYRPRLGMPTRAVHLVSSERALLRPIVHRLWDYLVMHAGDRLA